MNPNSLIFEYSKASASLHTIKSTLGKILSIRSLHTAGTKGAAKFVANIVVCPSAVLNFEVSYSMVSLDDK